MVDIKLHLPEDAVLNLPSLVVSYVKCAFFKDDDSKSEKKLKSLDKLQNNAPQPLSTSDLYFTNILTAKIIAEGEDIKTRMEMFLNVKGLEFSYLPGDSIGILPENSSNEVDLILVLLGLTEVADDTLEISLIEDGTSKKKVPSYIPKYTSIRHLLKTCLDLRSIVKKGFIRALVEYTGDTKEKRRLQELCSREGSAEYNKHILEKSLCLLDILQAFPSCKPSISLLIEHLPRLMPRVYSIASSPLVHPGSVRIVFNLVKDKRGRNGTCTSWLFEKARHLTDLSAHLSEMSLHHEDKNKIPIFLRKTNKFRIPETISSNMIMIGPGSGVAPFIGFLEHRYKQSDNGKNLHNSANILLFGCRYKDKDYIYKDMLELYHNKKVLSKLMVCFSRENIADGNAKYVQDLFKKEKEYLINLLFDEDTYLFICGDALNMVKDVQEVVINCISDVNGISKEEASMSLQNMEKDGKFVKDVWR